MEIQKELTITLEQVRDFEFKVKFDRLESDLLLTDEPEPRGSSKGPNAVQLLSAAVGNCLAASLLFCLRKADIEPRTIMATVKTTLTPNAKGRIRIGSMQVTLNPSLKNTCWGTSVGAWSFLRTTAS